MAKRKRHKRYRDAFAIHTDKNGKHVQIAGLKIPVFEGPLPVDEIVHIISGRVEDSPDFDQIIPAEIRLCSACNKDVWVSKTMLGEVVGKREYKVTCLHCLPAQTAQSN